MDGREAFVAGVFPLGKEYLCLNRGHWRNFSLLSMLPHNFKEGKFPMDNVSALEDRVTDLTSQMGLVVMKAENAESKAKMVEKSNRRVEEMATVLSAKIDDMAAFAEQAEVCVERLEKLEVKVQQSSSSQGGLEEIRSELAGISRKAELWEKDKQNLDSLYETLSGITEEIGDTRSMVDSVNENLSSFEKTSSNKLNQIFDSAKMSIGELSSRIERLEEKGGAVPEGGVAPVPEGAVMELRDKVSGLRGDVDTMKAEMSVQIKSLEEKSGARDLVIKSFQKNFELLREEIRRIQAAPHEGQAGGSEAADAAVRRIDELEKKIADMAAKVEKAGGSSSEPVVDPMLEKRLAELEAKAADLLKGRDSSSPARDSGDEELVDSFVNPKADKDFGFELDDLLQVMIKHQASDLHLKNGAPPTVRLEGELIPIGSEILSAASCKYLIMSGVPRNMRRSLLEKKELDFSYSIPDARFRVHVFLQRGTVSASYRMIKTVIPSIESLSLPPITKTFAELQSGLVLVTGASGCGKSTTLASIVDYVNTNSKYNIITIEDPIEYLHADKMSLIAQREIGEDALSYLSAMKSALREDPNVIMLGEICDADTLAAAITAAETGHLVLSACYSPNVIQTITRLVDFFPLEMQPQMRSRLASVLKGVLSQRLINRVDGDGRIPAAEALLVTPSISSLIASNKIDDIYPLMVEGSAEGMVTFSQSLTNLYESGIISKEDAIRYAERRSEIKIAEESPEPQASVQDDVMMSWL